MFELEPCSLALVVQIAVGLSVLLLVWAYLPVPWGAPWVPSSLGTARKMLQMSDLRPGELIVDMGAGDGKILILAPKMCGARAIGVEIDPVRCLVANLVIVLLGLTKTAHVHHGNMFSFDVSAADVVVLYLLQGTNQRLKEKLVRELRPGARVISHSFSISGWSPVALDDRRGIFLYEVGRTGQEVWTKFM